MHLRASERAERSLSLKQNALKLGDAHTGVGRLVREIWCENETENDVYLHCVSARPCADRFILNNSLPLFAFGQGQILYSTWPYSITRYIYIFNVIGQRMAFRDLMILPSGCSFYTGRRE